MFKFLWKLIKKLIKWSFIIFIVITGILAVITMNIDPEDQAKWKQERVEKCIADIGISNCDDNGYATQAYKDEQKRIKKQERAEQEAKQAEEKRKASLAQSAAAAKEAAEEKRKGFHCLSAWNGSHRAVVKYTKDQLRDPKSFEHIETRITPIDWQGHHQLVMQYRAKNGFGGMTVGAVVATVSNASCGATILEIN